MCIHNKLSSQIHYNISMKVIGQTQHVIGYNTSNQTFWILYFLCDFLNFLLTQNKSNTVRSITNKLLTKRQ